MRGCLPKREMAGQKQISEWFVAYCINGRKSLNNCSYKFTWEQGCIQVGSMWFIH